MLLASKTGLYIPPNNGESLAGKATDDNRGQADLKLGDRLGI